MRAGLIALLVVVVIAVVVALNSLFIINPMQQALVLQFGEVRNTIREPGLNVKIPVVQDVRFFDKRILDLNVPAQEIIAADQKRLVVDAFMRWRIENPVEFYQTVNNIPEGSQRLNTFVQASLRAVLADATFTDIVRDRRPELMQRIKAEVAESARPLGVEVVDVKIRRADLPQANSEAIYRRMQTEREQEAREIRAQGQEAARRITAAADRTATVLRAEAQRESEQIRGLGDGQKNAIFARAFTLDPQFFAFYRAMQAYEIGLQEDNTRLVLSPDAEFFRYFGDPSGRVMAATPTVEPGRAQTPATGDETGEGETEGEGEDTVRVSPEAVDEAADELGLPAAPTAEPASEEEMEAAREEIETMLEQAREEIEPSIVDPDLGTNTDALEAQMEAERQQRREIMSPAETSTEAAVETASPLASEAADSAASGTAGESSTFEPLEIEPTGTDTAPGTGTESGTDAASGSDSTPATDGATATPATEPTPDEAAPTETTEPAPATDAAGEDAGDGANVTVEPSEDDAEVIIEQPADSNTPQ